MEANKKQISLVKIIMILCLIITSLSYILGNMMYRTNTRNTYQNLLHVELTDFIENIRYGLHFGKNINTYFGMKELLLSEVERVSDIEQLYVVDSENNILFGTDDEEFSSDILELSEANLVQGDIFYAGMALTEDGSVRLLVKSNCTSLIQEQDAYAKEFLFQSLIGLIVAEAVILILGLLSRKKVFLAKLLAPVLFMWILTDSAMVGISAYHDYSDSIEEMNGLIEASVENDMGLLSEKGFSAESVSDVEGYLSRYKEGIQEIEEINYSSDKLLVIISKPYIRKVFIDYVLQAALFLTFSALILAEYQIFINYSTGETEDESEPA